MECENWIELVSRLSIVLLYYQEKLAQHPSATDTSWIFLPVIPHVKFSFLHNCARSPVKITAYALTTLNQLQQWTGDGMFCSEI